MRLSRLALPLAIISSVLVLLHYFIYSMATQSFAVKPVWLAVLMGIGCFLMPGALVMSMTPMKKVLMPVIMAGYVWMGSFMIALFFAIIQAFVSLVWPYAPSYWILIATPLIALWSLRINIFGPQLVFEKIKGPEFLHGLKMVQISDLHVGNTILNEKWLSGVVDKINSANPDILVITGDLADGLFSEASPMLKPLQRVTCQKFYVTGNHEYIRGGDWESRLKELGFEVLHNSNVTVRRGGGALLIAGVPDQRVKGMQTGLESLPDKALKSSEKVDYKILLAHEPSSIFDLKTETCDLILAGHTHGGQIFPFGLLVRIQQPVVAGFKKIRGVLVFAHQGTGFWGPPMRWFTRSEIVQFTWH